MGSGMSLHKAIRVKIITSVPINVLMCIYRINDGLIYLLIC